MQKTSSSNIFRKSFLHSFTPSGKHPYHRPLKSRTAVRYSWSAKLGPFDF